MQTNSNILNVDGITPEHVDEICKIITKHFCSNSYTDDEKSTMEKFKIKDNGFLSYHMGINYRDSNYNDVLRYYNEFGVLVNQARTSKKSTFVTFTYQGYSNGSNHNIVICIDFNGRFTYGGCGYHSIELEEVLSSLPFLIDFTNYIKWINVLNEQPK